MKKIIAILLCLLLSACAAESPPVQLPVHEAQIAEGQSVLIRLNAGVVTVHGGKEGQASVAGQTLYLDQTEYNVTTVNNQIQIIVNYTGKRSSAPPVHLEVSIPNNAALTIETDSASISVREYTGVLEAASVSGDILVDNVQGDITLRSNRGNVTTRDSDGRISMVGNYGLLALENARGNIGVSTIMGTIVFDGLIQADDTLRLETDHGPISVNLVRSSDLTLKVRSTSGDVACMLPDVISSARTCEGTINSGGGVLSIRTVSGTVTVQSIP